MGWGYLHRHRHPLESVAPSFCADVRGTVYDVTALEGRTTGSRPPPMGVQIPT